MFLKSPSAGYIPDIVLKAGLLLLASLVLLLFVTRKDSRIYKYFSAFPGPTPFPVVGSALSFVGPKENIWRMHPSWTTKYGTTFALWIGNLPFIFVGNGSDAEKILSSTVHINKGIDYETLISPWLGTGLLISRREKWHVRRKLLTPAFHFKILEDFIPVFNEHSKMFVLMLEAQRLKNDSFDICPFISNCTLDIICETAMGEKLNAQIGGEIKYVEAVCGITTILAEKFLNPISRQPLLWNMTSLAKLEAQYLKCVHDFTNKIIKDRKAERKRLQEVIADSAPEDDLVGSKPRKAFLDLLLDLQEGNEKIMSDADIQEEVDTFMFEGHDTTGSSLGWTMLTLACYPECQNLVHEELNEIFGDDLDRDVTMHDVKQMKYLERCIKETMRIYPSVPFYSRSIDQDTPLDEKRMIPKGCTVFISVYTVHRDPTHYPNPEKFDPDRFTTDNAIGRNPYAFIPFSAGPRNCIGQRFAMYEEKIILATLLRKFRLEAVDTRETVVFLPEAVLRPKDGIRLRLVKRS